MTWAQKLVDFYSNINPPSLPPGIEWLYPQKDTSVMAVVEQFVMKYFNDSRKRRLILGINPGRFGAGITGVNFTAPRQLKEVCGIEHGFRPNSELSAEFIYGVIDAYGGPARFYGDHFIGSVCPLGLVRSGRNINYYDDKELLKKVEPFIINSIEQQLRFPVYRDACICIGGEKNFKYLQGLNERYQWFGVIIPLPHPRFIMQYRRKQIDEFTHQYIRTLRPK